MQPHMANQGSPKYKIAQVKYLEFQLQNSGSYTFIDNYVFAFFLNFAENLLI